MEDSWLLSILIISALAISSFILNVIKIQRQSGTKLPRPPPGPKPWPIIGNLNLLGPNLHQSLHHLSQTYGEIMLLKFGRFPVVVASSSKMAEQFLKVHDAVCASRPQLAFGKHISYDYSDISFAPNGPYWREARKIIISELFTTAKLEKSEQMRVEERRALLSRLGCASGEEPVLLGHHLARYTMSIISRMVITAKHFDEMTKDESSIIAMQHLLEIIDEFIVLTGEFNVGDWIPWLGFLDLQGCVKKMKGLRKKMDKFCDYVIDDHLARKDPGGNYESLVDVLLQIANNPNAKLHLTRDSIKAFMMNLIVAAADTSAKTVEWAIHELMKQPRIIEKAKKELDMVIGRNRWVEESDSTQLPYIDAIIAETFRLHPVGTLLAPHYAIKDCNVEGYDISKGSMVLVNVWSMGRDPKQWDAPHEFLPERFLGKEIDMTGTNFLLLAFSSGRRRCPGYNLGLKTVQTTLANLLHGFDMKLEEGMRVEDISMEEKYAMATSPKHPLSIIFKPTLPAHLY